MTLDEAIIAHAHADAALRALVAKRIHPNAAPEKSPTPLIVFSDAARRGVHTHDGPSRISASTMQFDCWATRKLDAAAVADRLTAILDGFSGQMGAGPDEPGLYVSPCLFQSRSSDFDADLGLHAVIVQFQFWHQT